MKMPFDLAQGKFGWNRVTHQRLAPELGERFFVKTVIANAAQAECGNPLVKAGDCFAKNARKDKENDDEYTDTLSLFQTLPGLFLDSLTST